jgi:hypothetical protein
LTNLATRRQVLSCDDLSDYASDAIAFAPSACITREELQEQIWGNTFVDFDQSLNKAVNRVQEALNDNAGTPQYVETGPATGIPIYRSGSGQPSNGSAGPDRISELRPGSSACATHISSITVPDCFAHRTDNGDRARRYRHPGQLFLRSLQSRRETGGGSSQHHPGLRQ